MKAPHKEPENESQLQAWFVKELKKAGYLPYKFSSPAVRGVPDLIVIDREGFVFFVEMKHPNGKGVISPLQHEKIKKMLCNNAEIYIAASVHDCEDIINKRSGCVLGAVNYVDL